MADGKKIKPEMMDVPRQVDESAPIGDPNADRAAELAEEAEDILERHRENAQAMLDGMSSDLPVFYRVEAEMIGHRVTKPADDTGPIIVDYNGGLKKNQIITKDDIGALFGPAAVHQIPRFIRLGDIVQVIPYTNPRTGRIDYIEVPSHDHVPFTANQ